MTDERSLDHAPDGIEAAAAESWAVIDAMYSDALIGVAAIAAAAEHTLATRAAERTHLEWPAADRLPVDRLPVDRLPVDRLPVDVVPVPRPAADDAAEDVQPIADVVRVGGLALGRSLSRHAAAETAGLPRQVA